jgi:hypothetical protein
MGICKERPQAAHQVKAARKREPTSQVAARKKTINHRVIEGVRNYN